MFLLFHLVCVRLLAYTCWNRWTLLGIFCNALRLGTRGISSKLIRLNTLIVTRRRAVASFLSWVPKPSHQLQQQASTSQQATAQSSPIAQVQQNQVLTPILSRDFVSKEYSKITSPTQVRTFNTNWCYLITACEWGTTFLKRAEFTGNLRRVSRAIPGRTGYDHFSQCCPGVFSLTRIMLGWEEENIATSPAAKYPRCRLRHQFGGGR